MWYSIATARNLEIDLDHDNIDQMLHQYIVGQAPEASLCHIVPAFLAHIDHEERIIDSIGLKFPANHKKEHQRLSNLLRSYETDLKRDKIGGREFAEVVQKTLKLHVIDFDVKLIERFNCTY